MVFSHNSNFVFFFLPLTNVSLLDWLATFNTGSICKRQVRESVPSKLVTTICLISLVWACNYTLQEWGHKKVRELDDSVKFIPFWVNNSKRRELFSTPDKSTLEFWSPWLEKKGSLKLLCLKLATVAIEYLKCDRSDLICTVNVRYTLDFKDLVTAPTKSQFFNINYMLT